ncbi:Tyrosine-protein phosphatase non-receptor type 22 [Bulinus truncatus]|nr:Tyrosine-protein phosphatase non-receptor type 22 [Bulinus truncatus]
MQLNKRRCGSCGLFNTAVKLRRDRMLMIQTGVELGDPHDDLSDEADIQNSAMSYHYSMQLSDLKNRFPEVSPKKTYMVTLSRDKYTDTYINAVFVPSLVRAKHYILTQLPMHATVLDFWRMITQYKASLVVEVELESTVGDKNVETHQLTHLKSSVTSLDADLLLQLVIKLRTLMKNKNDRIVYMCRNGAQYSGLIYLLTMLLDRMDDDHQVSIPLVVGSGKSIRPQIIPSLDQYRCLYEVIQAYLQSSHSLCHYVNVGLINKPAGDTQIESNELFDDVSCDED